MQESPVREKSSRLLLLCLLLAGALGLAAYAKFHHLAFRYAALDLTFSKEQAIQRSASFLLTELGQDVQGMQQAAYFWTDDEVLVYLEKALGTAETNQLLRQKNLPVWGWRVRFFRPGDDEEYDVSWSPNGKLVGFEHVLPSHEKIEFIGKLGALTRSKNFLRTRFEVDFSQFVLAESHASSEQGGIQYRFLWKAKNNVLDSKYYLNAVMSGGSLTRISLSVSVPEHYWLAERELSSRRSLLQAAAGYLHIAVMLAAVLFLLMAWRRRWFRWQMTLGLTGLFFVVTLLQTSNSLPSVWYYYPAYRNAGEFWLTYLGTTGLTLAFFGILKILPFGAADGMGRLLPGRQYSLGELLKPRFYLTRAARHATLAGYAAAGCMLGFVVLYYLAGRVSGLAYSPVSVPYSNILATTTPWIMPLFVGFTAALFEESVYRVFAIGLFYRITGKLWVSLLLPAIIWGFLHTNYSVEPIFARGVELTLVGLFLGLLYLRFGIWSTIVAHYVYNASVTSYLLFRSNDTRLHLLTALVIAAAAIPLVLQIVRKVLRHKTVADLHSSRLTWPDAGDPVPGTPVITERRQKVQVPVFDRRIPVLVTLLSVLLLLIIPVEVKAPTTGIDRSRAINLAKSHLGRFGYKVDQAKVATEIDVDYPSDDVAKYLSGYLGRQAAWDHLTQYEPRQCLWTVEFNFPDRDEYYRVVLKADGQLHRLKVRFAEEKAGELVALEKSETIAANFLQNILDEPNHFLHYSQREHDFPQRKEYSHWWYDREARRGEFDRIATVRITGHLLTNYYTSSYLRQDPSAEERRSEFLQLTLQEIFEYVFYLLLAAVIVRAIFNKRLIQNLKDRVAIKVGLGLGLLNFIGSANNFTEAWFSYDLGVNPTVFYLQCFQEAFGQALGTAVMSYAILVMFFHYVPQVFSQAPGRDEVLQQLRQPPWRWPGARSGWVWALAVTAIGWVCNAISGYINQWPVSDIFSSTDAVFQGYLPALGVLLDTLEYLPMFAALGVGLAALRKHAWPWYQVLVLCFFVIGFGRLPIYLHQGEFLDVLKSLIFLLVVVRVVRFQLSFYLWFLLFHMAFAYSPWLFSGSSWYAGNAAFLWLLLILPFLPLIWGRRRGPTEPGTQPERNLAQCPIKPA